MSAATFAIKRPPGRFFFGRGRVWVAIMLQATKERYATRRSAARHHAVTALSAPFGVDFHLSGWNEDAQQAYATQWGASQRHPDSNWDWPEIFRRYNEWDRLDLVMWGPGDRLCGLGLATLSGMAVKIRFLEGDPRPGCPLKGKRAAIALD